MISWATGGGRIDSGEVTSLEHFSWPGYYCDSTTGPVQDFSLHPCPQGYFCPLGTAMATQHSCPEGTYGAHKGLKSINECELCPAGKFCALAGLRAPTGMDHPGVEWLWTAEGLTTDHFYEDDLGKKLWTWMSHHLGSK